jgi:hypothetical protein
MSAEAAPPGLFEDFITTYHQICLLPTYHTPASAMRFLDMLSLRGAGGERTAHSSDSLTFKACHTNGAVLVLY